jgi:hypothetical protein
MTDLAGDSKEIAATWSSLAEHVPALTSVRDRQ